jgi:hypothetical protein
MFVKVLNSQGFTAGGDIPFGSDLILILFLTLLSASFERTSEERVYLPKIRGGSDWSLVALAKVVKINFALLRGKGDISECAVSWACYVLHGCATEVRTGRS